MRIHPPLRSLCCVLSVCCQSVWAAPSRNVWETCPEEHLGKSVSLTIGGVNPWSPKLAELPEKEGFKTYLLLERVNTQLRKPNEDYVSTIEADPVYPVTNVFWLKIFDRKNLVPRTEAVRAVSECNELIAIFLSSTKTADANGKFLPKI